MNLTNKNLQAQFDKMQHLNLIEEKKEEVLRNLDVDELEKKLADL